MDPQQIRENNRKVYDSMAAAKSPLCRPATDKELASPLQTVDGCGWLGSSIAGKHVLCLAAGGGRQSSLYAEAGAVVTVVDISGAMLELDRQVALAKGYHFRLIENSMESLPMLRDGEFDIVIHPVSTCYVPNVSPVFREVGRITRPGGLYISQHKQPVSLQSSLDPNERGNYEIENRYYRTSPVPPANSDSKNAQRLREKGAIEFVHRWEQIIGGICRSGFVIEDLTEPMHGQENAARGSFADRANHMAPYVRIKARRRSTLDKSSTDNATIWLPNS
ncbi:MAG: class I SAM-dependent methyltransferase [Rubripirellula sp.]